ncbi:MULTISPECIES: C40 family peptidase [Mycolicibacter]|uniref:NlpC/P60 family protein n=2 Tax=Mycolicibacter TaxID=1073531 RepID=A0ABU5XPF5_9MYCO|nr:MULTISPECIES: NlpC/P60 family protein [unclassified Mycolicibacter]MEB3022961.1 NlpC/P60 family protein [Mycolicibacter sp. MYC098]MEB3033471.1 NlpC/P60 family protein [Mycolicibacter sp. MYC340]
MTSPEIRVNPAEAAGTMAKLSGQFAATGGSLPLSPSGLDPSVAAAVDGQVNNSQQTLSGAGETSRNGKAGAEALGSQDRENSNKAAKVDSDLKTRPGDGGAGGAGRVSRADAPRLTASDLAKLTGAGQYQSPMPTMQTAPAGAPSMPSMPSIPAMPMSGAAAPIQSMLGPAGALSPLFGKLMATGGPKSLPMGAALEGQGGKIQALVKQTLGTPYAWGGGSLDGPSKGISDGGGPADRAGDYNKIGYDCSGLARFMTFQSTGHEIPRTSEAQYAAGTPVSAAQARPGDLFFPNSSGRPPGHVQVYIGNNQVVEAPSSGQTVKISPLRPGEFRRMVA